MARQYGTPPSPYTKGTKYGDEAGRTDPTPQTKQADPSPSADMVVKFHKNAPIDTRQEDMHHTLGPTNTQASPGNHSHKGGDSVALFDGLQVSGSRGGNVALASLITILTQFGLKDNTSA